MAVITGVIMNTCVLINALVLLVTVPVVVLSVHAGTRSQEKETPPRARIVQTASRRLAIGLVCCSRSTFSCLNELGSRSSASMSGSG
ncbi:unnamed protein product [Protopolystoma xenopodis]|uniref:Uncharacterized protein n=1 Tax=Protopolystoma xenopodis TaxID=117903 RepID=A0A3S5CQ56_9PLAT|nr:unnamed protein product [Protopolystoma xenopodis]